MKREMAAWGLAMMTGLALAGGAWAQDLIVEKKVFEMPTLTMASGQTIKSVKVGWESYGTLNADKSNVILITHFFSGNSHAAGKYSAEDKVPGYWDAIIGPGKAIDTNKYYVISSDTLVNLNTGDPKVVTTGPASINPDTGKPYGLTFPVTTIGDFVSVQKALLDSLGITRLHAVMGASMGALQAYEWAARHPDMVQRIIPVIGTASADPYLVAWLDVWSEPIRLDPNWNKGDYYGKEPPARGLAAALKIVTLHAQGHDWAVTTFGRAAGDEAKPPLSEVSHRFRIESVLDAAGAARAKVSDANHFLYLAKASQSGAVDAAKMKTPALVIYAPTDQVFSSAFVEKDIAAMRANGAQVEALKLDGPNGHLNGVLRMAPAAEKIKAFLER